MDTCSTHEPVCPYCGAKNRNAWEIDFGPGLDGDTTCACPSCGEDYFCSREVSVSYSTAKLANNSTG